METGVRVVRGSDWILDDSESDGGEGFVGTVVEVGGKSFSLPENLVWVQWDSGIRHDHRAGYYGAYDLCVLDNAPIGVAHQQVKCAACKQKPILGIRWHCVECKRSCDLCTSCYMRDEHEKNHRFSRIDVADAVGINVGVRHSVAKVQSRGIFPGSKVMRGPDWEWGNRDGGKGKEGVVKKITDWQGTPASAAVVSWDFADKGTYRLGYQGKVDLRCTTAGVGGFYYKSHLPRLGDKVIKKENSDSIPNGSQCSSLIEERANDELTDEEDFPEKRGSDSQPSEEDLPNDQLTDDEEKLEEVENGNGRSEEDCANDQMSEDEEDEQSLKGGLKNDQLSSDEENLSDENETVDRSSEEDEYNDQLADDEDDEVSSVARKNIDQDSEDIENDQFTDNEENLVEKGNMDQSSDEDVEDDHLVDGEDNWVKRDHLDQGPGDVENYPLADGENLVEKGNMDQSSEEDVDNDKLTDDEDYLVKRDHMDRGPDDMVNYQAADEENWVEEENMDQSSGEDVGNDELTDDEDYLVMDQGPGEMENDQLAEDEKSSIERQNMDSHSEDMENDQLTDDEENSELRQEAYQGSECDFPNEQITGSEDDAKESDDGGDIATAGHNTSDFQDADTAETGLPPCAAASNSRQPVTILPGSSQEATEANLSAALDDSKVKGSRSLLHKAAIKGQWKTVKMLLENGEDVDQRDQFDITPLHLAAWYGQEPVVKVLLEHKADVNTVDKFQKTPLHKAQRNNHMAIVQLLKAKSSRTSPQIPSLRSLSKMGLVHTDKRSGLNLIQAAAFKGNYDIILKAIVTLDDPIREMNMESTMNNCKVSPGKTAYDILSGLHTSDHDRLKALFEETFERVASLSDLHGCANTGDVEKAVELVFENEVDINVPAMGNRTPLLWGSAASCSEAIECLIALGADTNALRDDKVTALMLAVEWNNYMTVKVLAQNGADLDVQDENGNTPLHVSVKKGSFNMAEVLIKSGCNVNIQNNQGESPLHLALEKDDGDIAELLLKGGADPNVHKMQTFEDRLFLVLGENQGKDSWYYVLVNKPLLGLFSKEDNVDVADFGIVLESGSGEGPTRSKTEEINSEICGSMEGTHDVTPLHLACVNGDLQVIELLVNYGADVNVVDADGYTPLQMAAIRGKLDVVKKLVELKADIHVVTMDGRDALHLARLNKEQEVEKFFMSL